MLKFINTELVLLCDSDRLRIGGVNDCNFENCSTLSVPASDLGGSISGADCALFNGSFVAIVAVSGPRNSGSLVAIDVFSKRVSNLNVNSLNTNPLSLLALGAGFLVVAQKNAKLAIFKLIPSHSDVCVLKHLSIRDEKSLPEKITAVAFYTPQTSSHRPCIFFGTESGEVGALILENGAFELSKNIYNHLNGPVNALHLDPNVNNPSNLTLFVARGARLSQGSLAVVHVNLDAMDVAFTQSKVVGDLTGETTAFAVARDGLGHRVVCVTKSPSLSQILSISVHENDINVIQLDDLTTRAPNSIQFIGTSAVCLLLDNERMIRYSSGPELSMIPVVSEDELFNIRIVESAKGLFAPNTRNLQYPEDRRRAGKELTFDALAKGAAMDGSMLYPVKTTDQLMTLLNFAVKQDMDEVQKSGLIYYLLKDVNVDLSMEYAYYHAMPTTYLAILDGFWCLDHGDFEGAIINLTSPFAINPYENTSKILQALFDNQQLRLASMFMKSMGIDSAEWKHVEMGLKLESNLFEAFLFQRPYSEKKDYTLLHLLIETSFKNEQRTRQLISLPFTRNEESELIEYCESNKFINKETSAFLLVYYIQRERYAEAVLFHEMLKRGRGGNETVDGAYLDGLIANLALVLPEVQAKMIETEVAGGVGSTIVAVDKKEVPVAGAPVISALMDRIVAAPVSGVSDYAMDEDEVRPVEHEVAVVSVAPVYPSLVFGPTTVEARVAEESIVFSASVRLRKDADESAVSCVAYTEALAPAAEAYGRDAVSTFVPAYPVSAAGESLDTWGSSGTGTSAVARASTVLESTTEEVVTASIEATDASTIKLLAPIASAPPTPAANYVSALERIISDSPSGSTYKAPVVVPAKEDDSRKTPINVPSGLDDNTAVSTKDSTPTAATVAAMFAVGTPKLKDPVVRVGSPFMKRPLTPTREENVASVEQIMNNHEMQRSESLKKNLISKLPLSETSLVNNAVERSKAVDSVGFTVIKSPVGKPQQLALPLMNLSPFASKPKEPIVQVKSPPKPDLHAFEQELKAATSATHEFETKRQLRKTPARVKKATSFVSEHSSSVSETSEAPTSHYSLRTTRRTTMALDQSSSAVSTPAKTRAAATVSDSTAKMAVHKTPRSKKGSATATPARSMDTHGDENDDPMTLEELSAIPVATTKKKVGRPAGAGTKSAVKAVAAVAETPGRVTRRTAKLLE
ncbi:UNVERIFIED_CONTAM: hypothetical protein HDU68_008569 [Siphonaria sp. JEL0065]|nr:hypothetical protein HDU68_008569 [Siphonaria sp. JEL0065]